MAANAGTPSIGHRRHRRRNVMSEINVTPMVDVMLVLLIIFMVSAPLLTVGVPIDLPQSQATSLDQDKEPLTLSVNDKGQVFLQNSEISINDLVPKLKAVAEARGGTEARIYVRGDRKVDYGTVMKVMGRLSSAGFHRVALVTEVEQGSWPFARSDAGRVDADRPRQHRGLHQARQGRQGRAQARNAEAARREEGRAEADRGGKAEAHREERDPDRQ